MNTPSVLFSTFYCAIFVLNYKCNLFKLKQTHSSGQTDIIVMEYPGTTSFRPPKKYLVSFYLLSSPIVLVIA